MSVTIEDLTAAIQNGVHYHDQPDYKLEYEEAYDLAHRILNFFGYSERIIDNVLEQEDRDAFYMLEDAGILTTEREETTLYDGREWRIHYWLFKDERIDKLKEENESADQEQEEYNPYADLPDDAWNRSGDA